MLSRDEFAAVMRPRNLSRSSIKTYYSNVKRIHRELFDSDIQDLNWIEACLPDFFDLVSTLPPRTAHNLCSTLISVGICLGPSKVSEETLDTLSGLNESLVEAIAETHGQKSESMEANWASWDEIRAAHATMQLEVDEIHEKRQQNTDFLSYTEYRTLWDNVLWSLFTASPQNPPRRLLDWSVCVWGVNRPHDTTKNYCDLHAKMFTFNVYKGSKRKGMQQVRISPALHKILLLWREVNFYDAVLPALRGRQRFLSQSTLTKHLHRISMKFLGRKISCNILRSSYVTNMYQGMKITGQQAVAAARDMGHSVNQAMLTYLRPG